MSYYKPTSLPLKVLKVFRLYALLWRAALKPQKQIKLQGHSVLHVISEVDRVGGLELQALELARALANQGQFITVLSDTDTSFSRSEFRNGFLLHRLKFRSATKKVMLFFATLLFFLKKGSKYNVLHVHGVTGFTLFALRLGKWFGRPVVLKGSTKNDFRNIFSQHNWKHRMYQHWLRKVDCCIAISEELQNEMTACGIPTSKISRIPNIVNSVRFRPPSDSARIRLRSRFSVSNEEIVFLFLGRLVQRKGADVLLKAWKVESPGMLWIVGDGPEKTSLEKLARDLGLTKIQFFGNTGTPLDYYQAADVFILPSRIEGMPSVTLEAMSCGLPIVATSIGGVVDQIENEREGLLVPAENSTLLSDAIRRMACENDNREKWKRQALQTVREKYDASRIALKYQQIYSELCKNQ
jgi:glycogen synthase